MMLIISLFFIGFFFFFLFLSYLSFYLIYLFTKEGWNDFIWRKKHEKFV